MLLGICLTNISCLSSTEKTTEKVTDRPYIIDNGEQVAGAFKVVDEREIELLGFEADGKPRQQTGFANVSGKIVIPPGAFNELKQKSSKFDKLDSTTKKLIAAHPELKDEFLKLLAQ